MDDGTTMLRFKEMYVFLHAASWQGFTVPDAWLRPRSAPRWCHALRSELHPDLRQRRRQNGRKSVRSTSAWTAGARKVHRAGVAGDEGAAALQDHGRLMTLLDGGRRRASKSPASGGHTAFHRWLGPSSSSRSPGPSVTRPSAVAVTDTITRGRVMRSGQPDGPRAWQDGNARP